MIKDKFLETSSDQCIVTIYNGDEILCRFKFNITNVQDYDDEIIFYGDNNDFVILDLNHMATQPDEYYNTEYLFGSDRCKIGITFPL